MQVIDEVCLDRARFRRYCEFCRLPNPGQLHPHHCFGRGMGGGSRIDLDCTVAALCWECHNLHHAGHRPLACDILALVAQREGILQDDIKALVRDIRRLPRDAPMSAVLALIPKPRKSGRKAHGPQS